jgi:A/G-specific adenine glycosylase
VTVDLLGSDSRVRQFRVRLLDWYAHNKRDLPWRDSGNPYHVWISEIMLQQTRVDQMQPFFERFTAAFPTVEALAAASLEEVLKAWEGLGYYARARNLHRAAKHVVKVRGGRIPDRYEELMALPGIGPYTAAAVSSIAFDRDHPVLDGNVTRVLCRLLRLEGDPRKTAVKAELIAAGERLLARGRAGDFNQAMMELGARVCTPTSPACGECAVVEMCRAHAELEDPAQLPTKVPKPARPHYEVTAGVIWKGAQLLVAQRPADGMLGGLWEFPGGKREPGESLPECLRREIREELTIDIEVGALLAKVDHGYSHFSITLNLFEAIYRGGEPEAVECDDWRWIDPAELDDLPMPRADRRALEELSEEGQRMPVLMPPNAR